MERVVLVLVSMGVYGRCARRAMNVESFWARPMGFNDSRWGRIVANLPVGVAVGVVNVAVPPKDGHMLLPERRASGYKTLGAPPVRVTAMFPLESVVKELQIITSTRGWLAVKPVADEARVIDIGDEEDPTLVNTPMSWDPGFPLRVAMVWPSE